MENLKYAVVRTLGNREDVLKWFEDRDDAVAFGQSFFKSMRPGEGVLTVEGFRVNKDGKTFGTERRICDGWHF